MKTILDAFRVSRKSIFVQILLSVMSLVAEPNIHSPANVDAAKMWRDNREEFFKIASIHVDKTLEEPPGNQMGEQQMPHFF